MRSTFCALVEILQEWRGLYLFTSGGNRNSTQCFDIFQTFGSPRMPVVLLDRIPLPSLRTYTAVSVVLLACAIYYAHNCALSEVYTNVTLESSTLPEDGLGSTGNSTEEAAIIKQPTDHNKTFTTEEYLDEIMIILVEEAWCVWVSLTNNSTRGYFNLYFPF